MEGTAGETLIADTDFGRETFLHAGSGVAASHMLDGITVTDRVTVLNFADADHIGVIARQPARRPAPDGDQRQPVGRTAAV